MRNGMELNKNIGRKSLHHFVQRLLVRSVRQQVRGPDDVSAECSKQERQHCTKCTECVAIWETGDWPQEWTFSTFIPLLKKDGLK